MLFTSEERTTREEEVERKFVTEEKECAEKEKELQQKLVVLLCVCAKVLSLAFFFSFFFFLSLFQVTVFDEKGAKACPAQMTKVVKEDLNPQWNQSLTL
jgi:hypothetical protein